MGQFISIVFDSIAFRSFVIHGFHTSPRSLIEAIDHSSNSTKAFKTKQNKTKRAGVKFS